MIVKRQKKKPQKVRWDFFLIRFFSPSIKVLCIYLCVSLKFSLIYLFPSFLVCLYFSVLYGYTYISALSSQHVSYSWKQPLEFYLFIECTGSSIMPSTKSALSNYLWFFDSLEFDYFFVQMLLDTMAISECWGISKGAWNYAGWWFSLWIRYILRSLH